MHCWSCRSTTPPPTSSPTGARRSPSGPSSISSWASSTGLEAEAAAVEERRHELARAQQRLEDEIATVTEQGGAARQEALQRHASPTPASSRRCRTRSAPSSGGSASWRTRSSSSWSRSSRSTPTSPSWPAERTTSTGPAERAARPDRRGRGLVDAELAAVTAERAAVAADVSDPTCCRPVRRAPAQARRHRHRPARRRSLRRLPPGAVGGRGRPHPQAAAGGAGHVRGVRPPPRSLAARRASAWSSGSSAPRS